MGKTASFVVEQGFKTIGYEHLDFKVKAAIAFMFVMLPINLLLLTCCILSWELYKVKKEEANERKNRLLTKRTAEMEKKEN